MLRGHAGFDLRTALYPDDASRDSAAERLTHTAVTQAAVFSVELAIARLWMSWGIRPNAVAGHSMGEIAAGAVAQQNVVCECVGEG